MTGRCAPKLVLASRSPRRRAMLTGAGLTHRAVTPEIDDGELSPGSVEAASWVEALSFLKARSVAESLARDAALEPGEIVLGADTVCVVEGRVIGQPADRDEAGAMIRAFMGREHEVLTGVTLLEPTTGERSIFVDRARVRLGSLGAGAIESYLESEDWRGKAGAYNFAERLDAGWPLECDGDPATVMGLPMRRLGGAIEAFCAALGGRSGGLGGACRGRCA